MSDTAVDSVACNTEAVVDNCIVDTPVVVATVKSTIENVDLVDQSISESPNEVSCQLVIVSDNVNTLSDDEADEAMASIDESVWLAPQSPSIVRPHSSSIVPQASFTEEWRAREEERMSSRRKANAAQLIIRKCKLFTRKKNTKHMEKFLREAIQKETIARRAVAETMSQIALGNAESMTIFGRII